MCSTHPLPAAQQINPDDYQPPTDPHYFDEPEDLTGLFVNTRKNAARTNVPPLTSVPSQPSTQPPAPQPSNQPPYTQPPAQQPTNQPPSQQPTNQPPSTQPPAQQPTNQPSSTQPPAPQVTLEVATQLGPSRTTVWRWRKQESGPKS